MRHLIRRFARATARAAVPLALAATAAGAQVTIVDEGSFTILKAGQRAGTEVFVIKQTPGAERGMSLVSSATITAGERRVLPALQTDDRGAPLAYQIDVRMAGESRERLVGRVGRGRVSAQMHTAGGECAGEIVVSDGARLVDEDVFHHYYFLVLGNRRGVVPVIVPRQGEQITLEVVERGAEPVTIGGRALAATRLGVRLNGAHARDVWVDGAGRVLKVEIPARGVVALRDEPPR